MELTLTHKVDEGVRISNRKTEYLVRVDQISLRQNTVLLRVIIGGEPELVNLKEGKRARVLSDIEIMLVKCYGNNLARIGYNFPEYLTIERGEFYGFKNSKFYPC